MNLQQCINTTRNEKFEKWPSDVVRSFIIICNEIKILTKIKRKKEIDGAETV